MIQHRTHWFHPETWRLPIYGQLAESADILEEGGGYALHHRFFPVVSSAPVFWLCDSAACGGAVLMDVL